MPIILHGSFKFILYIYKCIMIAVLIITRPLVALFYKNL